MRHRKDASVGKYYFAMTSVRPSTAEDVGFDGIMVAILSLNGSREESLGKKRT